jgi:hypothetical protein
VERYVHTASTKAALFVAIPLAFRPGHELWERPTQGLLHLADITDANRRCIFGKWDVVAEDALLLPTFQTEQRGLPVQQAAISLVLDAELSALALHTCKSLLQAPAFVELVDIIDDWHAARTMAPTPGIFDVHCGRVAVWRVVLVSENERGAVVR